VNLRKTPMIHVLPSSVTCHSIDRKETQSLDSPKNLRRLETLTRAKLVKKLLSEEESTTLEVQVDKVSWSSETNTPLSKLTCSSMRKTQLSCLRVWLSTHVNFQRSLSLRSKLKLSRPKKISSLAPNKRSNLMSRKSGASTSPHQCFLSKSKMPVESVRTRLLKQERPKVFRLKQTRRTMAKSRRCCSRCKTEQQNPRFKSTNKSRNLQTPSCCFTTLQRIHV